MSRSCEHCSLHRDEEVRLRAIIERFEKEREDEIMNYEQLYDAWEKAQAEIDVLREARRCECSEDDMCRFAAERDEARAAMRDVAAEMRLVRDTRHMSTPDVVIVKLGCWDYWADRLEGEK